MPFLHILFSFVSSILCSILVGLMATDWWNHFGRPMFGTRYIQPQHVVGLLLPFMLGWCALTAFEVRVRSKDQDDQTAAWMYLWVVTGITAIGYVAALQTERFF